LSAHTIAKDEVDDLTSIPVRPLLDDAFLQLFRAIEFCPAAEPETLEQKPPELEPPEHEPPEMKPVGVGVFATNNIIPQSDSSIKEALVSCFQSLTGLIFIIALIIRSTTL
jgi:hypothetical protein